MRVGASVTLVIVLGFVLVLASQPAPSDSVHQVHFAPLPPQSAFSGCGCMFTARPASAPSGPAILFSSNYEGAARVAWNGAVIQLTADQPDTDCRPSRVGGRCTLKYRGADIRVEIKSRATWVCPAGDASESCEVVRLSGQMRGRVGELSESVEVSGECGC